MTFFTIYQPPIVSLKKRLLSPYGIDALGGNSSTFMFYSQRNYHLIMRLHCKNISDVKREWVLTAKFATIDLLILKHFFQ